MHTNYEVDRYCIGVKKLTNLHWDFKKRHNSAWETSMSDNMEQKELRN